MSSPQLWERIYDYIHEYQHLVYEYYAKDAHAFLVTYYHLNKAETVWDDEYIDGGSYEEIGDLTGIRWDKILLLPVFFIEEISPTQFDATEIGQNKLNETSFVIPSEYGFTPYAHDILKFEQSYLSSVDNVPLFHVTGIESGPNTDKKFWRIKVETDQSRKLEDVENQTLGTYAFLDYNKQIHTLDNANKLLSLMDVNNQLRQLLLQTSYDKNTGFYFI